MGGWVGGRRKPRTWGGDSTVLIGVFGREDEGSELLCEGGDVETGGCCVWCG